MCARAIRDMIGVSRKAWLLVAAVVVVIAFVLYAGMVAARKQPVVLPPQDIAARYNICILRGEAEKAFGSFYAGWDADPNGLAMAILGAKKMASLMQPLERTLGPVEIPENETFDKASRVVVPFLSVKARDQSTEEIKTSAAYAPLTLERQDSNDPLQWRIVHFDPRLPEIEKSWLNLPRKKVPRSPTIILKKAIVMQVVSDGKVVSERTISYDE
jgi:hypothetical protein